MIGKGGEEENRVVFSKVTLCWDTTVTTPACV